MSDRIVLRGCRYSVYNRIAQIALHEKDVSYQIEEISPFGSDIPKSYLERHPFQRVPVLSHGQFDIYETSAIVRYVDGTFKGTSLEPTHIKAKARVAQVVSILDSYGYQPMVRQVFAHRVFRPAIGEMASETEVLSGIARAKTVLDALERIATEGFVLDGEHFTIADCHLAPMIAYFNAAPEGAGLLQDYSSIARCWSQVSKRKSLLATDPGLPDHTII